MEDGSKPHALVLPLPGHGHINPMLSFSLQLASRGFIITFLVTEQAQDCMKPFIANPKDARLHIRFFTMPGESLESAQIAPGSQNLKALLDSIESQQAFIEDMVLLSRASSYPITCIVSDSFFPWTQPLASKLGIKRVLFWTFSGMSLASMLQIRYRNFKETGDVGCEDVEVEIGGIILKRSQLLATIPKDLNRPLATLNGCEHTTCIVVNTFEELEASSLEASACETRVCYVGPLLPPSLGKSATMSASSDQEESYCLQWLDKQAKGSVLYIAFGSAFSLTEAQLEEVAAGIEESKQSFLWVIRDGCSAVGQEFLERTSGYGLVIKWAPQIRVLNHASVGAFLTHCGWNSTMESLSMGVPMITFPIFSDQPTNCTYVCDAWKVGMALKRQVDGSVTSEGVERVVRIVLHEEEGKEMRKRATKLMEAARQSVLAQGSSNDDMEKFIQGMKRH